MSSIHQRLAPTRLVVLPALLTCITLSLAGYIHRPEGEARGAQPTHAEQACRCEREGDEFGVGMDM